MHISFYIICTIHSKSLPGESGWGKGNGKRGKKKTGMCEMGSRERGIGALLCAVDSVLCKPFSYLESKIKSQKLLVLSGVTDAKLLPHPPFKESTTISHTHQAPVHSNFWGNVLESHKGWSYFHQPSAHNIYNEEITREGACKQKKQ
jgi:hypothetical protein